MGDGTLVSKSYPVPVNKSLGLKGKVVQAIASGYTSSLALTTDNVLCGFGQNQYGVIGDGTTTVRSIPVTTWRGQMGNKTISKLKMGHHHAVVLTSDAYVFTWGMNDFGQLGDSTVGK